MIRMPLIPLALALAFALALPAAAAHDHEGSPPAMTPEQQAAMAAYQAAATPGDAHARLAKMTGTYDLSIRSWQAPGSEPSVEAGTATRRMILDGRVMVEDVQSSAMGQPFTGTGMHGYDNVTGKHWSTWNDTMSTGLMVSEGDCDAADACTFVGSWNDPITGGKTTARMTSVWTSPSTELFSMHGPGPDGKEFLMMEITYTRRP